MRVVIDIETNGLENPSEIWVICCRDIDTDEVHTFRKVTSDATERERFLSFAKGVERWVGHNILGFDRPVLHRLIGDCLPLDHIIDTLIVSRLVNYSREKGHSIEAYGEELGDHKISFEDFSQYTPEMEVYCEQDTKIGRLIYLQYASIIDDSAWQSAITMEHEFQHHVVNSLHENGFCFDTPGCRSLLERVQQELSILDKEISDAFPPRLKLIREITPKTTKHGTLSKVDFKFVRDGDLSVYNGGPFCHCEWVPFNASSHSQIVRVLNEAGWRPTHKTQTHIETERELKRLQYQRNGGEELDLRIKELYNKLQSQIKSGWKVDEQNLDTLPEDAPKPARLLAKRILLESRRRTLTEWLNLVSPDSRIRGKFFGIGCWTHRMAHQNPNTANIPTGAKLYGAEMRALWGAPVNRLLVGVDAEGIQLRIFAHLINDKEFTDALVNGRKEQKTDPHSLNARVLGSVCKGRQVAKRFIYALLLGAGLGKLAEILECSLDEAKAALDNLLVRYQGFAIFRNEVLPRDGERGYFIGLDGRKVPIPSATSSGRKHLAMSGYLQNGEAVVMKMAALRWMKALEGWDFQLVNFVHDEWQTECPNNMKTALHIAKTQADSLRIVGEELKLNCPLAGSYWNEDHKDYTIGVNWQQTH